MNTDTKLAYYELIRHPRALPHALAIFLCFTTFLGCVADPDESAATQKQICLKCGGDTGGGGTTPPPPPPVTNTSATWTLPTSASVSTTTSDVVFDTLAAAEAYVREVSGDAGWTYSYSPDAGLGGWSATPRCGSGGWIGCQARQTSYYAGVDEYDFVCWVVTPIGSAYCTGTFAIEEVDTFDGDVLIIKYKVHRSPSGECGSGTLRC